jgi:hypothetical protein
MRRSRPAARVSELGVPLSRSTMISTRRLFARPSAVSLLATGLLLALSDRANALGIDAAPFQVLAHGVGVAAGSAPDSSLSLP